LNPQRRVSFQKKIKGDKLGKNKKDKEAPVPILWSAECVDFDPKFAKNRFASFM